MKGLVLKDLYSVKHQITLGALLGIFPAFVLICMTLGYANGDGKAGGEWFVGLCFALLNYCTVALCSSFCINTVSEDVRCGWIDMARTMPLSEKKICGGKILSSFIVVFIMTLITFVPNIFALAMGVGSAEVLIAAPVGSMLLQMAVMCPVLPFALKFGGDKASAFYICLLIAVVVLVMTGIIAGFKSGALEVLRSVIYLGVPLLAAVSVSGSLSGSRKIFSYKATSEKNSGIICSPKRKE